MKTASKMFKMLLAQAISSNTKYVGARFGVYEYGFSAISNLKFLMPMMEYQAEDLQEKKEKKRAGTIERNDVDDFLTKLQPHYNTVVYSKNSVITRLRLCSQCLHFPCIIPSL